MKITKLLTAAAMAALLLTGVPQVFADSTTSRFGMTVIDVGSTNWGPKINTNTSLIDQAAGVAISNVFTSSQTFNNAVGINGTLTQSGGAVTQSSTTVNGALTQQNGTTTLLGPLAQSGGTVSQSSTTITGSLTQSGGTTSASSTTVNGSLAVTGASTFTGSVGAITGTGATFNTVTVSTIGSSGTAPILFDVNGIVRCRLDTSAFANYDSVFRCNPTASLTFPEYSWLADTGTGLRHVSAGVPALTSGGIDGVKMTSVGTADFTTYNPLTLTSAGASAYAAFRIQTTTGVTTGAQTFLTIPENAAIVIDFYNDGGGNQGTEILLCSSGVNPTVVSTKVVAGSPQARTYTASGSAMKVSFAANTYTVSAFSLGIPNR